MIIELKAELERVANDIGAIFTSKSNSELQDFVQGFDFANPLINLKPIETYGQDIIASGAIRYDFRFELFFLTKFQKSDHLEDTKDVLIDDMTQLSELFFTTLNKNENQYFINPAWKWTNGILRQYLSNLTCGVQASIFIDTSCNRVDDGFIPPSFPCPEPETWDELAALIGRGYNYPIPTGHTTIFRTGDDADIEQTVFAPVREANSSKAQNGLVDFLTLVNNNSFGNADRFTDSEGGQDYDGTGGSLIDYIVDNYTGLGWHRVTQSTAPWNDAIDNALSSTLNSFSDWFLPNHKQLRSIGDTSIDLQNNYVPFSINANLYSSSTRTGNTTQAFTTTSLSRGATLSKTTSTPFIFCRKHF